MLDSHPTTVLSTSLRASSTTTLGPASPSVEDTVDDKDLEKVVSKRDYDVERQEENVLEPNSRLDEKKEKQRYFTADGQEIEVVDWESEADPTLPKNWSDGRRMAATLVVAAFTFLSPTSSSMIAPASSMVAEQFKITNDVEISMITSAFVAAYAVGPLFLGPLSELYGRVVVLQISNIFYLVFNLVCAFSTNAGQLIAFRFLAGLGGSAPLAIGAGVLSDLWRPEERGRASALYSIGPLLGPAVGPVCGGWLAERLPTTGWKWVFYSTTIVGVLIQGVGLLYLRESFGPVLLKWKAKKLRIERGLPKNTPLIRTIYEVKETTPRTPAQTVAHGLVRPFSMVWKEHILKIMTLYMTFTYGLIYICTVTTTPIFQDIYHESVGIAGTNFVAQGLGFFCWAQCSGRLIDYVYRKLKERNGGAGQPEYRLVTMIPASLFLPFGFLIYGWGAQHHLHWIAVDIGLFFIAAGMIGIFQSITSYLIDTFTLHAASALAAASSLRSLAGFTFPLFSPYLFAAIGYGWGCTLLACLALVIGLPAAPVLFYFGARIRATSQYAKKH